MRYLSLFVAIVVMFASFSFKSFDDAGYGTAPDYDSIEVAIFNSSSPYFYPDLLDRYQKDDSTLTLDDYYYLYYGFTFYDRYEPIVTDPYQDSLMVVLQLNQDNTFISPEIFGDVLRVSNKILESNPFDLNILNIVTFVYQMSGDEQKAIEHSIKMKMIKEVILASGSGVTKDSPWHVTRRSDENAILSSFNAQVSKVSYFDINVEYVSLNERILGVKGLYFNIGRMWIKTPEERKKPEKRFEFNPANPSVRKRY